MRIIHPGFCVFVVQRKPFGGTRESNLEREADSDGGTGFFFEIKVSVSR